MINLQPALLETYIKLIELPHRLLHFFIVQVSNKGFFKNIDSLSDSQKTPYENFVKKVIKSEQKFKRFRRSFDYRLILEHLTYKQGLIYLEKINKLKTTHRLS